MQRNQKVTSCVELSAAAAAVAAAAAADTAVAATLCGVPTACKNIQPACVCVCNAFLVFVCALECVCNVFAKHIIVVVQSLSERLTVQTDILFHILIFYLDT